MVLDQLTDGASRLLSVSDSEKRLLFILCLPLVDGVFATLLVTGAVQTFSEIVAISLTVFTGAGALAVLYSESESREEAKNMVLSVAPFLVVGALIVSLVAPVFEQLFYLQRLRYAAGLALLVIASKIAEVRYSDRLSVPAVMLTGLLLSVRNPGALVLSLDYVIPAVSTAAISLLGLYAASYINPGRMNLDYVRRGASLVLVLIAASMYGVEMPSELGLAVFGLSLLVALRR